MTTGKKKPPAAGRRLPKNDSRKGRRLRNSAIERDAQRTAAGLLPLWLYLGSLVLRCARRECSR